MVTATNRRARASNHPDVSSASLVVRTLLPVALSIVILVGCGPAANQSSASPATETGSAVKSPQRAAQASAMIGGLGHGGYNPDFVWCQLRGTEAGMVFHGTLSGPNIGTNKFDVSTGQPSNGRTPTSPTDGIFALKFSGQGPSGPFTCTLTSVDVPAGFTLAPHQESDWTLTVT